MEGNLMSRSHILRPLAIARAAVGLAAMLAMLSILAAGCSPSEAEKELKSMKDARAAIEKNLATFDTLDFTVFTNQQWTRLHESHAKDIKVHWPDGHTTVGIDTHIEDLKAMFVYAPDTRVTAHPIRIGDG
jgi:hypothetical protein